MSPWSWRACPDAWFGWIASSAALWRPAEALRLDESALRRCLAEAALRREPWLLHPCLHPLTTGPRGEPVLSDLRLAAWTAAHATRPMGRVCVPHPTWVWTEDGGRELTAGEHLLSDIGAMAAKGSCPVPVSIDLWCISIGTPLPATWAARADLLRAEREAITGEIVAFLRTVTAAGAALPDCMAWITAVTRVAIPLAGGAPKGFRSGSVEDLPGVITLDFSAGDLAIVEALVYESAHLHLYLAEEGGALVDPAHHGRYRSPLHSDLRPLRRLLKTYHALAYISAFYADALDAGMVPPKVRDGDARTTLTMLVDAERTILGARPFFTSAGLDFVERTRAVSDYAKRSCAAPSTFG